MRKVSMATREELISAVRDRYRSAGRKEKGRILDEFARITGYCQWACNSPQKWALKIP